MTLTLTEIETIARSGPFTPDWPSLTKHATPRWYEDGKFGIFIHWGVYSVPAFGSEWYPRRMYTQGEKEYEHHLATYGPHAEFGYKDFIPQFRAERFDPAAWAGLFAEAGARFVVPVAEHHDGFAMYDTALSEWNAARMGPRRDVIGELAAAVRGRDLVFGASSHRAEHHWFFDEGRKFPSDVSDPRYAGLYGPARPAPVNWHDVNEAPPDEPFLEDWLLRTCELVEKYRPQLIWFDWWIQHHAFKPWLKTFAAFYYNSAAKWGQEAAINYKYDAFEPGAATLDIERGQLAGISPTFWQNDTSVARNSWGNTANMEYKSARNLICDLVDVVSKNGALLLNIGPRADGTIPDEEQALLREIGGWLSSNGESIYGTRPWRLFGEGPTDVPEGAFTDTNRGEFTGEDLRFTRSTDGGSLFVTVLGDAGATVLVRSLAGSTSVRSAALLADARRLTVEPSGEGLRIHLPPGVNSSLPLVIRLDGHSL